MDPITLMLIGSGLIAGAVVVHYLRRRRKQQPKTAPKPQPKPTPAPAPPKPTPPPRRTTQEIIDEVVSHIAIARKRVQVGWKDVGTKIVGERIEEVPYPSDAIDIRPIRSLAELPARLPTERTSAPVLQLVRAASGQALVVAHHERIPITEPVREPIYRDIRKVVYLLLDVSPSMFGNMTTGYTPPDRWWMIPVWKGIALALLSRARAEEAIFMIRSFGGTIGEIMTANSEESAALLARYLSDPPQIGSTDIRTALTTAINDVTGDPDGFDQADIMILTDGQSPLDPPVIRAALTEAKIRLHAIVLGTDNEALKRCADVYQEIPEAGVIRPPVRRT